MADKIASLLSSIPNSRTHRMPSAVSLSTFIAMVVEGDHVRAIETWYHEDASMQENANAPRVGRALLVEHETAVLARASDVQSECLAPPWRDGDRVVIHWRFRFRWANGTHTEMEEVALQEWRGEKIWRERFFYDPAQLRPVS